MINAEGIASSPDASWIPLVNAGASSDIALKRPRMMNTVNQAGRKSKSLC